jgi:hypothetical protein
LREERPEDTVDRVMKTKSKVRAGSTKALSNFTLDLNGESSGALSK